jgi:hypothetical protein
MPDYYAHSKEGKTTSEQNLDPAIGEGATVICRTGRPTDRSFVWVCLRMSRERSEPRRAGSPLCSDARLMILLYYSNSY